MEVAGLDLVRFRDKGADVVLASQPQLIVAANAHVGNNIQRCFLVVGSAVVTLKFVTVKAVQPVHCSYPNETTVVLCNFEYIAVAEAIFKVVYFELILGRLSHKDPPGTSQPNDQSQQQCPRIFVHIFIAQ